jgi:hypothetical protein
MEMIHEQRIKLGHIKYSNFIIDYDILQGHACCNTLKISQFKFILNNDQRFKNI